MSKLLATVMLSLATFFVASSQPTSRARQAQAATCTLDWLRAHQAARETWGTNRGPLVDPIIRAGGGNPADRPEWCGFTQAAANRACGLPIPAGGMQGAARAWFTPGPRLVWLRARNYGSIDSIRPGLKAGFDYGAGIHHIACVATLGRPLRAGRAPRSLYTYAGNEGTGPTAGLHYTLYSITSIDALANWLY